MTRVLALAAALASMACGRHTAPEPEPAVSASGGAIVVSTSSPLMDNLSVVALAAAGGSHPGMKAVGQVIALANAPAELAETDQRIDWVELDETLDKAIGLDLSSLSAAPGDVVGYTELPVTYARNLRPGERIVVNRYGLTQESTQATILFLRLGVHWAGDVVPIVFRMSGERGWLPGASCEVTFPMLSSAHVHLPTTALLHEGAREYVLRELGRGRFAPVLVTLGEGDTEKVEAVMGLEPGERIVARGAILLKPLLHQIIAGQRKNPNGP